jgi:mannose-6-phosphate isomerase-like protein (cupin superfamily)
MGNNVKNNVESVKHPSSDGVFMKHFYGKEDTGGALNNLEVSIMPGFCIGEHVHNDSNEFFYVVSGQGDFLDGGDWVPIKAGDAFKASKGVKHAIRNNGDETLRILSIFSPPNR